MLITATGVELLDRVLEAHGGLERWQTTDSITARLSLGGPFWELRGWPEIYDGSTVELDTTRELITFAPFIAGDRHSSFDASANRVAIETADGKVIAERDDPLASFPPFEVTVSWDALQVASFTSYAVWNYLTTPFLLASEGVQAREIDPWREDGETWRRLAVTFPAEVVTHNREQTFYFDNDFMLRRLDYQPRVTGAAIAHFADEPKTFDGFVFPTRRRVFRRAPDNVADKSLAVITIAIDSIDVHTLPQQPNIAQPLENRSNRP